ncbi:RagB/SusD family nutrient uptake outer membrane protein [termite gut metagenome]|uniref:RagB/SusD family nutrient uptake outer membrane protein n=1 Tax=termite gut metagenome TaxID=433724 RepID=A0A5J4T0T0_9ZZZZ
MKIYKKIIVLVLCANICASCVDFLQTESNSTFTEETAFENLDFAEKMVYGIYAALTASNMYGNIMLFTKSGCDIELVPGADDNARRALAQYTATDGNTQIDNIWNAFYDCIERANVCVDNLPNSPVWEGEYAEQAKVLYGEAVALRALCYYELVSLWGDVPFTVKSAQAGDNFYIPKRDRDEIYEYLVEDLKKVEEYVPWMTNTAERVNKAFVKGLRARMALAYAGYSLRNGSHETRRGRNWQEYYGIANQECREIIESRKHQLNPSFEDVFKGIHAYKQDVTNKEVLFEVAFGRGVSGRIAQVIGMRFPTSPADAKYGRAAAEIAVPISYFYSFTPGDSRRNVSVELYDYNTTSAPGQQRLVGVNQYKTCKWRRSWIVPNMGGDNALVQLTGVNWPIMRYSDILLMLAETENEIHGNPTSEAIEALTVVRKRAFNETLWNKHVTEYIGSVSISKNDFFEAIVNERAWEFGGEMYRKYDLVRWNLLGNKIQEMKDNCRKIINKDPEYSFVPTYIYWRTLSDGETIDILNQDYRYTPDGATVTGYTRAQWLANLSASNKTSVENFVETVVPGYNEEKNNHLFPLSMTILDASNGVLSNDQMP